MPSSFRIPRPAIDGAYGAVMRRVAQRTWGQVPDNAYVLWHNQAVLKAVFGFERKVAKWDALDAHLKTYARDGQCRCHRLLVVHGLRLLPGPHQDGLDEAKVREVPRWRESEVFTDLERDVMAYAEAMTTTPLTVTDEMVAAPRRAARPCRGRRADDDGRDRERALALQLRAWVSRARVSATCASLPLAVPSNA